jgi:hypothetical protein
MIPGHVEHHAAEKERKSEELFCVLTCKVS